MGLGSYSPMVINMQPFNIIQTHDFNRGIVISKCHESTAITGMDKKVEAFWVIRNR